MVTAIDFVSSYMRGNSNIRNAMIVGAQMVSRFAREDDPITYATSGDGSAAVILQTSKEKSISGYLGAVYRADSKLSDKMRFPACGMSRILDEKIQSDDKKMLFIPHDVSYFADEWKELIIRLLNKNTLKPGEVGHYLFSQFSHADIYSTLQKLNVDTSKHTFVADKYGYTGCTSPIFALNEAIEENRIKLGDYVVFCTVGIGFAMSALLYKF
jgi:3-oxoacyl-[acyl-carrier-protein] synthase-3